jgi:plastocyanin
MKSITTPINMRRLREAVAAVAVLGGSLAVAAPALAADTNVNLTASNTFDQASLTVQVGDTVTFVWQGGFHDVKFADGVNSGAPVGIDGSTFARTFDAPGSYGYVCSVHESSGMVGTVTVEGSAAVTTTAAATASTTTLPVAAGSGSGGSGTASGGSGGGAGGAGAGSGSSSSSGMPFTGPERSVLPFIGVGLIAGGLALRLRLRSTS